MFKKRLLSIGNVSDLLYNEPKLVGEKVVFCFSWMEVSGISYFGLYY